jgi:hypothetical protein
VGLAPTGKRRLFTAHAKSRHSAVSVGLTKWGTNVQPKH